jgi:hypothetical protein
MIRRLNWVLVLAVQLGAAETRFVSLHVEPAARKLNGAGAHQQLLVLAALEDGRTRDVTGNARWNVSNPKIVQVDASGLLRAMGDGAVVVTATVEGRQAQARFEIRNVEETRPFEFGLDIGGILTRQGCNGANCHGGVKGRGGFKLSAGALFPKEDYEWIVKGGGYQVLTAEVKGPRVPRINFAEPEKSLLLQKPTQTIPHGGGRRFTTESAEYSAILKWIREGAPFGPESAVNNQVARLEVSPAMVALERGEKHRLLVTAHFTDGRTEDFTDQALFTSNDRAVASVDGTGQVLAGNPGETAVLVRSAGQVASATIGVIGKLTAPYPQVSRTNFVDDFVFDKLRRLRILPSARSTDSEFLRRVCLDLTGTLPPPERVREFLANGDPRKRDKLVETLMGSPEFVDYWTFRFSDLFRVSVFANGEGPKWSQMYGEWIRASIATNKPYDQIARERIAAQGYDGPTRHYLPFDLLGPPGDTMAEEVRVFFGRRLDCAQCHNHPYESWSQDQYWGMAAFFGRQFLLRGTPDTDREYVVVDRPLDEEWGNADVSRSWPALVHPRTKVDLKPTLLDGTVVNGPSRQNPRKALAEWMIRQPYFTEAAANRIWSYFFGRGLVEPVDDFRSTNPPTHPELLKRLAEEFRSQNYDLRYLMRVIISSSAYQLSGKARDGNEDDHANYSHSQLRPLDAEVLLDAICDVTGSPEMYKTEKTGVKGKGGDAPLPGTRAINLGEPDLFYSRFLDVYGRPNRLTVPERSSKPNLGEALEMLAGPVYNEKLGAPTGRLQRLLNGGKTNEQIVEEFYLAAYARLPEIAETKAVIALIDKQGDREAGLKNFAWAVLSSREFAENH